MPKMMGMNTHTATDPFAILAEVPADHVAATLAARHHARPDRDDDNASIFTGATEPFADWGATGTPAATILEFEGTALDPDGPTVAAWVDADARAAYRATLAEYGLTATAEFNRFKVRAVEAV